MYPVCWQPTEAAAAGGGATASAGSSTVMLLLLVGIELLPPEADGPFAGAVPLADAAGDAEACSAAGMATPGTEVLPGCLLVDSLLWGREGLRPPFWLAAAAALFAALAPADPVLLSLRDTPAPVKAALGAARDGEPSEAATAPSRACCRAAFGPEPPAAEPGVHLTDTWQLDLGLTVPVRGDTVNTGLDRDHSYSTGKPWGLSSIKACNKNSGTALCKSHRFRPLVSKRLHNKQS